MLLEWGGGARVWGWLRLRGAAKGRWRRGMRQLTIAARRADCCAAAAIRGRGAGAMRRC